MCFISQRFQMGKVLLNYYFHLSSLKILTLALSINEFQKHNIIKTIHGFSFRLIYVDYPFKNISENSH